MSVSERVAPHLPYLRRFARAVTGSQTSGDAYVVSTLEALLADPSVYADNLPPRVALYRAFLKILNSVELNNHTSDQGHPGVDAVKRNLESLTPPARQAFLLESVEPGERVGRFSFIGVRPRRVRNGLGGMISKGSRYDKEISLQAKTAISIPVKRNKAD